MRLVTKRNACAEGDARPLCHLSCVIGYTKDIWCLVKSRKVDGHTQAFLATAILSTEEKLIVTNG